MAEWTPASVSGGVLWMDAESGVYSDAAGTTLATDGQRVRAWRSRIGEHLLVENDPGPAQPTYNATRPPINNRPSITFADPGGTFFKKAGVTNLLTTNREVTFFFGGTTNNNKGFLTQGEGGGATDKWMFNNGFAGANCNLHVNGSAGAGNANASNAIGAVLPSTAYFRRQADGTTKWDVDGTVTNGSLLTNFSMPNTGDIQVGAAEASVMNGELLYVLLYDRALTDGEISLISNYFSERYA